MITFSAEAIAFCVTAKTTAGSSVSAASSRIVYRFVHLPPVLIGGAPAPEVRASTDQRQHRFGELAHAVHDFTLA